MLIGKVLKSLRKAKGWKQADASRLAGMTPGEWSGLETDRRPGLTVDKLRQLARAFDISGSDLLELIEISET